MNSTNAFDWEIGANATDRSILCWMDLANEVHAIIADGNGAPRVEDDRGVIRCHRSNGGITAGFVYEQISSQASANA